MNLSKDYKSIIPGFWRTREVETWTLIAFVDIKLKHLATKKKESRIRN